MYPPGPQATLSKLVVADAGSRDHDYSNPAPVSSRTRRKLMLEHREDGHEVVSADMHASLRTKACIIRLLQWEVGRGSWMRQGAARHK